MALKTIHECGQLDTIKDLKENTLYLTKIVSQYIPKVDDLVHVINGNGQKGLRDNVIILSQNVNTLNDKMEEANLQHEKTNEILQGLSNFKISLETTFEEKSRAKAEKEVKKVHVRWLIGTVIVLSLGVISLLIDMRTQRSNLKDINSDIQNTK
jgi:hypothetical protein